MQDDGGEDGQQVGPPTERATRSVGGNSTDTIFRPSPGSRVVS
jgi:hypothetical protein